MKKIKEEKNSPIVVAMDLSSVQHEKEEIREESERILRELEEHAAGIKIGVPLLLSLGLDTIGRLIRKWRGRYFFICDTKMADIGYINELTAALLFDAGFDGIIAHAAVGAEGGLIPAVRLARKLGRGVLGLCAMSHPGADEFLNRNVQRLLAIAERAGVDGFVLPASRPDLIRKARRKFPEKLIFSPGVGAQGAPFGSAVAAGADFEIIGRSITQHPHPSEKAREILEAIGNAQR